MYRTQISFIFAHEYNKNLFTTFLNTLKKKKDYSYCSILIDQSTTMILTNYHTIYWI